MSSFVLRDASAADAAAITTILNHYIAKTTTTFILEPHTVEKRLDWFKERSASHPAIAAELDGELVAWGALSPHNPRGGYRHTADTSVYVRQDMHRRGIGRSILSELITRARAVGHHTLSAQCCAESRASIALHESLGFRHVGEMREIGRKFDRWLDVVLLQLLL
jgi:phosphinothricin acetyltransferase